MVASTFTNYSSKSVFHTPLFNPADDTAYCYAQQDKKMGYAQVSFRVTLVYHTLTKFVITARTQRVTIRIISAQDARRQLNLETGLAVCTRRTSILQRFFLAQHHFANTALDHHGTPPHGNHLPSRGMCSLVPTLPTTEARRTNLRNRPS